MISGLPRKPSAAKEILANLRLVATEVPQVGLFRTTSPRSTCWPVVRSQGQSEVVAHCGD